MKSFGKVICFLFLLSCGDNGYQTTIDFYKNHRYEFLNSGLVNQNFEVRNGYYAVNKNGNVKYYVLVVDTTDIKVTGDLNYFNSVYKFLPDTFRHINRIDFKLHDHAWIAVVDSSERFTLWNNKLPGYFLDLEKLRQKWGILSLFKYSNTITIGFYDKEDELIYRATQNRDIRMEKMEKLDSLWTYKKLKKNFMIRERDH